MNARMAFDLVAYGFIMAALSLVAGRFAPVFTGPLLITGLGAGTLSLLLGILGLRGYRHRKWTLITLAAISGFLVCLAANAWRRVEDGGSDARLTAVLTTVMLVFSIGQLIFFARSAEDSPDKGGGDTMDKKSI